MTNRLPVNPFANGKGSVCVPTPNNHAIHIFFISWHHIKAADWGREIVRMNYTSVVLATNRVVPTQFKPKMSDVAEKMGHSKLIFLKFFLLR